MQLLLLPLLRSSQHTIGFPLATAPPAPSHVDHSSEIEVLDDTTPPIHMTSELVICCPYERQTAPSSRIFPVETSLERTESDNKHYCQLIFHYTKHIYDTCELQALFRPCAPTISKSKTTLHLWQIYSSQKLVSLLSSIDLIYE